MAKKETIFNKLDGHCAYCGKNISLKKVTMDHVIPKSLGGSNTIDNLLPACKVCNSKKGSSSLEAFRVDFFKDSLTAQERSSQERMLNAVSKKKFYFEKLADNTHQAIQTRETAKEDTPGIITAETLKKMESYLGYRAMMKVLGRLIVCHYVIQQAVEEYYMWRWSDPIYDLDEQRVQIEMATDEFGRTKELFLDLVELRYKTREIKSLSILTVDSFPEKEVMEELDSLEKQR